MKINVYESRDALRVPISALFRKRDQWTVYAVESGRARSVTVEIGQRNSSFAEVVKGLPEGALVVLHPSDRIMENVRIVPFKVNN